MFRRIAHLGHRLVAGFRRGVDLASQAGQTTAEYALVILGAAGLAGLLITWATKSNSITRLFDAVLDKVFPK